MMNFNDLRIYVAVVNSGSFTAAAEQLLLTKQFVSRRIALLETSLSAQLLVRNTRKLSVTDAGQAFLLHAQRILDDVHEAEQAMSVRQHALSGSFKMSLPMTYGVAQIAPLIAAFQLQHPAVQFHIDLSDRYVDLIGEGFDLVLRIGDLIDSNLMAKKLAAFPMRLCASPVYLNKAGIPASTADLLHHQCLLYGKEGQYGWKVRETDKTRLLPVSGTLTSNNGEIICNAAEAGLGIALLPDFIVASAVKNNRLQLITLDAEFPPLTLNAVYPRHRQHSAVTRALLAFLADHIPGSAINNSD